MRKRAYFFGLIWAFVFLFVVGSVCKAADKNPSQLYQNFVKALKTEQETNKEWLKWQEEKTKINKEILSLKLKIRYLQFRNKQLDNYITTISKRIDKLEQKKKEAEEFKVQLEPYLDEIVERLETFVKSDMPFFPEERAKRIDFLKSTLNDYELSISEKTRRILQAVIVETKYGNTSDVTDQFIVLKKEAEPVYAQVLRIGRIGLFYLTPDSKTCGMYDKTLKIWKPVPNYIKHNVLTAIGIVEGRKRAKWIELPIQRIKP